RGELRQLLGAYAVLREPRVLRRQHLVRSCVLRETPRALHHDIGGGELPALDPGLRPLHVALELREGGVRLADDALEPRRMALVFGAHLLVEDLDALLRPGEGETGEPKRLAMLDAVRGHEPAALGHLALDVR